MRRSLPSSEERRGLSLSVADVDVVRADDTTPPRFTGHAAVFDTRTAIGNPLTWGFYEEIAPGAFTRTISQGDARMLVDHDSRLVVARVAAGTLTLSQDKIGLAVDAAMDTDLSYVSDLMANLRNGNIDGMSFGFYVKNDVWSTETVQTSDGQEAEVEVRRITEVELLEVSAVTFPAYKETAASLRHSLVPALRRRGDPDAIERLARYRPELAELLDDVKTDRDSGESTREPADTAPTDDQVDPAPAGETADTAPADEPYADAAGQPAAEPTDDERAADPGESTRLNQLVEARMRALKVRFRLPAA